MVPIFGLVRSHIFYSIRFQSSMLPVAIWLSNQISRQFKGEFSLEDRHSTALFALSGQFSRLSPIGSISDMIPVGRCAEDTHDDRKES